MYLDLESWNRKQHFYFFKEYDHPFFNICADVDVTHLLPYTKEHHLSFFIASLFLSMKVANAIPEFRYRIRGERVIVHDVVHAGSTVLNADQTFSFCYFDYDGNFRAFNEMASRKLGRYQEGYKSFETEEHRDDLIHYSIIPWISFTSFSHARKFKTGDSIPKIVFGKYFELGGVIKMPVSVEVHHSLMDGIHVGKFFDRFQELLQDPGAVLQL
jgi:chloramphenicol O-acetyltransferase type A